MGWLDRFFPPHTKVEEPVVLLSMSQWIAKLVSASGASMSELSIAAIEKYVREVDEPFVMLSLERIDENDTTRLLSRIVLDERSGSVRDLQSKSDSFRAEAEKTSCGVELRHQLSIQLRDVPGSLRFLMERSRFLPASMGTYELVFQKRPEPWRQLKLERR